LEQPLFFGMTLRHKVFMKVQILPLALALLLAACGSQNATEASGLTPPEDEALNDAAAAMDGADAALIENVTKPR
jgi:ABC-type glycerol-3-phosphate transport system substrate-binding protein